MRLDLENDTGSWHLLALLNWEDALQDLNLSLADFDLSTDHVYLAREFWSSKTYKLQQDELILKNVEAHGTALLALRPIQPELPTYLGGDLHISQGLEVSSWEPNPKGINLVLSRPGKAQGIVELYLPQKPSAAWLNGEPLHWETDNESLYQFAVDFSKQAQIRIDYG